MLEILPVGQARKRRVVRPRHRTGRLRDIPLRPRPAWLAHARRYRRIHGIDPLAQKPAHRRHRVALHLGERLVLAAPPIGLGDQRTQPVRREGEPRAPVILGRVQRARAFGERRERAHVVVAQDNRRAAFGELPGRVADVGLVARIQRAVPRDNALDVDRTLPRLAILLGKVPGPVPDDRLQEDGGPDGAALQQLGPFPVARHAGVHGLGGRLPLRMERQAVEAVGIARPLREFDRVGRGHLLAPRHGRNDVQHRERIGHDDLPARIPRSPLQAGLKHKVHRFGKDMPRARFKEHVAAVGDKDRVGVRIVAAFVEGELNALDVPGQGVAPARAVFTGLIPRRLRETAVHGTSGVVRAFLRRLPAWIRAQIGRNDLEAFVAGVFNVDDLGQDSVAAGLHRDLYGHAERHAENARLPVADRQPQRPFAFVPREALHLAHVRPFGACPPRLRDAHARDKLDDIGAIDADETERPVADASLEETAPLVFNPVGVAVLRKLQLPLAPAVLRAERRCVHRAVVRIGIRLRRRRVPQRLLLGMDAPEHRGQLGVGFVALVDESVGAVLAAGHTRHRLVGVAEPARAQHERQREAGPQVEFRRGHPFPLRPHAHARAARAPVAAVE